MALSNTGRTDSVRFDKPQDWPNWSPEFKGKAKNLDLWDYLNPDDKTPWPTRPVAPAVADYAKRLVRVGTRSASSSQTTPGTLVSDEIDTSSTARTISELTTDGKENYKLDLTNYIHIDKQYTQFRANHDKLVDWIKSTVGPSIRETCCDVDKTIDEWYEAFQEVGSAYEHTKKESVRARYRNAVQPLTKLPHKFDTWITEWEAAMAHGRKYNCAETMEALSWAGDLSRALRGVLGNWSGNFVTLHRSQIKENTLKFREVASELHDYWSTLYKQAPVRGVVKGAFPSFGPPDNTTDDPESDQDIRKRKNQKSKSQNKLKRKRADSTEVEAPLRRRCKACLAYHETGGCYYTFPHLAPEGWTPRLSTQKMVADRIKADSNLAEEINRLRKAKDAPES